LHLDRNFLVLFAALDTFVEVFNAFFDVGAKHVIDVYLFAAAVDDLVANLGEQTLEAIGSTVVLRELPDDSNVVQNFWQDLGDVLGLGIFNGFARSF
jgi:hypothetical protein